MSDDVTLKKLGEQYIIVSAGNHNVYLSKEQAAKLVRLLAAHEELDFQLKFG